MMTIIFVIIKKFNLDEINSRKHSVFVWSVQSVDIFLKCETNFPSPIHEDINCPTTDKKDRKNTS